MTPPAQLELIICDPDEKARHRLDSELHHLPVVEAVCHASTLREAIRILGDRPINAIFIDPAALDLEAASQFIFSVRQKLPHIVFCLHIERSVVEDMAASFYDGERARFRHYYALDKDLEDGPYQRDVRDVISLCTSDVRVFSEIERLKKQRSFYLETLTPEPLHPSLKKFRKRFPGKKKVAFVMMSFSKGRTHERIFEQIKDTFEQFGIHASRADDCEFDPNLQANVHTYLHGCDLGVAVFERVEDDFTSPNVAYEVGYLNALRKPICILKDDTIKTLPTDLLGTLYDEFSTKSLKSTIKKAIRSWMARQALDDSSDET